MNLRLSGSGTQPKNIHWGTGTPAGDAANSDVALFNPSPEARVACVATVITTAFLGDTTQYVGTLQATGGRAITELSLHDTNSAVSPTTTVTGSLTSGATGSQVVAAAGSFPATGNFYAQIDNEVVVATFVDATHISLVSRGALGSTAASHLAGAVITLGGDGGAGAAGATSAQTATVDSAHGGSMTDHINFAVVNLNVNDSITWTIKKQLT